MEALKIALTCIIAAVFYGIVHDQFTARICVEYFTTAAVAEHLSLTQSQKEAIQQVMTRERHHMEPLMAQLRSIREKLLALDPQHSNKKEIKTLADAQAALLAKFIVANTRMQSEIYKLLTPEQQRKLDDLKRIGESGTVASR